VDWALPETKCLIRELFRDSKISIVAATEAEMSLDAAGGAGLLSYDNLAYARDGWFRKLFMGEFLSLLLRAVTGFVSGFIYKID
jgi:hypothetical protein